MQPSAQRLLAQSRFGTCMAALALFSCANVVDEAPSGTAMTSSGGATATAVVTSGGSNNTVTAVTSGSGTNNGSGTTGASTTSASTTTATSGSSTGNTATSGSTTGTTATSSTGSGGAGGSTANATTTTATATATTAGAGGTTGATSSTMSSTTSSTTGGDPGSCLFEWREDPAAGPCVNAMQSDQQECAVFLDCYLENECSPTMCSVGPEQPCHENPLMVGGGGKGIAANVFNALCGA